MHKFNKGRIYISFKINSMEKKSFVCRVMLKIKSISSKMPFSNILNEH